MYLGWSKEPPMLFAFTSKLVGFAQDLWFLWQFMAGQG